MDETVIYQVVEYKTAHELFKQKFVWTGHEWKDKRDGDNYDHHFFYNEITTEELTLPITHLEYMITRPLRKNETE